MEVRHEHPIETFDPLLRDLIGWGLVERHDGDAGTWQLVPTAQRRLDELRPSGVPGAGAVVYLDRLCSACHRRGLTRLHDEVYVCDSCWAERQGGKDPAQGEPSPAERTPFWRRSRQPHTTTLAG